MGRMTAVGCKDMVDEGQMSLDNALMIHLRSNHYPPIPSSMVPVAKRALAKANKGEWNKKVRLPEGVEHRVHGKLVPVHIVMEYMHLDSFLDQPEEDFDDYDYIPEENLENF